MTLTFGIRSWEGTLLRLSPKPSGGAKLDVWDRGSKAWKLSDRMDKFMASPLATLEELAAAGLLEEYVEQFWSELK